LVTNQVNRQSRQEGFIQHHFSFYKRKVFAKATPFLRRLSFQSATKSGAGFTLIETLIYIAFFAVLMGSLLGITYQTIAGTCQINKKIVLQQESNFILRKIDWALTGASGIPSADGPDIVINRFTAPINVEFKANGNFVDVNTGSGFMDLNSQNVLVSNLVFLKISSPLQPDKIQAGFDINCASCAAGELRHFQIVKYLRE
jgi:type II secretory pathway pseudopilin PulG